jgi:hypothetical protein
MRKLITTAVAAAMLIPVATTPALAQRWVRERVVEDDDPDYYDSGYYDGREHGYDRGYRDGRNDTPAVDTCKRRKGKGAVAGALAGGLVGHLTSRRNKLANTAIGAAGGGLLGDLVGARGKDYDC